MLASGAAWGCSASSAPQVGAGGAGSAGESVEPAAGTAGSTAGATTIGGTQQGGATAHGGIAGGSAGGETSTAGAAGAAGSVSTDFCGARDGLLHCETFEAQAAGPAQAAPPWTPSINGDGTLEIDATTAHSGGQSLKVHGSGFSTFLVLAVDALAANAPSALHVRAYVRLAEAMTAGHNTFVVADLAAAPGAGNAFRLGEMNAMLMYTVSGDTHGALANDNYYTDHLPGAAIEPLTWSCLQFSLDHGKPEVTVALDGVAIPDLHHTDWPLDPYDALRFGFEKYAGPVSDIWYDDIAVGTAPIACD